MTFALTAQDWLLATAMGFLALCWWVGFRMNRRRDDGRHADPSEDLSEEPRPSH